MPDLWYAIGTYVPPNTADVFFWAHLARRFDRAAILHGLEDWQTVVADWRPSSDVEAVAACSEAVVMSGAPNPAGPPFVFEGTMSLDSLYRRGAYAADAKNLDALAAPIVRPEGDGWVVQLWLVDYERSALIECSTGSATSAVPRLSRLRETEKVFLFPFGP